MTSHAKAATSQLIQRSASLVGRSVRALTTLRVISGVEGAGPRRPARRALRALALAPLALLVVVCVLPVAPVFASGPPTFEGALKEEAVYSTRAHIAVEFFTGELETEWVSEYSTGPGGPWTESAKGKTEIGHGQTSFPLQEVAFLGTDATGGYKIYPYSNILIHRLEPEWTYYARFHAKNKEGEATSDVFPFTMLAVKAPEVTSFQLEVTGPHTAAVPATEKVEIETNGAQTEYHFEYAPAEGCPEACHAPEKDSGSWVPFTTGATGTITTAEDFALLEPKIGGLSPETTYFARVRATNSQGTEIETPHNRAGGNGSFTTPTARPMIDVPSVRNLTGTSAQLRDDFLPHGSETVWRFEYRTSPAGGWQEVPGAKGVVSQAQAEALPEGVGVVVEGSLAGLSPASVYDVRLFAKNTAGEGETCRFESGPAPNYEQKIVCELIRTATAGHGVASFKTFGAPVPTTFAVHGLDGEVLRLMGAVNPDSVPTSGEQVVTVGGAPSGGTFTLTFKGQTTVPIAFNAPGSGPEGVEHALAALSEVAGAVTVTGPAGGPYTVFFSGRNGEVAEPAITGDGLGLAPPGAVTVKTVLAGGEAYDTHYHFEYVSQKQFAAAGGEGDFAKATSTPEVDLGSGASDQNVGADLPGLTPGETYRFRVVARNTSPGNPVKHGEEEVLTVPVPPVSAPEAAGGCANERFRTGPSALLPDCRAYEQLTPVDKEGTKEVYSYGGNAEREPAHVGQDGEHFEYGSPTVKWGAGAGAAAGQSPYFFTRTGTGWQVSAATTQPSAGVSKYTPQVFSADLTGFAFEAGWKTGPGHVSPDIEFMAGAPGGPYAVAAVVPRAQAEVGGQAQGEVRGWVAASADLSKAMLQVEDHTLLGYSTHTAEGADIYEYSNGKLAQVNVSGPAPGVTVGKCGANVADVSRGLQSVAEAHSVSPDGSRVFFEAAPSSTCSDSKHLYMRVNGAETVDIGVYRFLAADSQGSKVLLEKPSGENPGLYLYETGSATTTFLPSSGVAVGANFTVSEDLSTVYIFLSQQGSTPLYRYDVDAKSLLFVTQLALGSAETFFSSSPEGRYFYFIAVTVAGLPGGRQSSQVYRYDSAEAVVQCMSCASSFDPEPRLSALFTTAEGGPTIASANGDYVFFDTPAALVKADVDGEVAPEKQTGEHGSASYSVSSDVYEWRRVGVGGCVHLQGCLALITSGGGGFLNILLGATLSGRDVFFATSESLLASDSDTASDIYDARRGGGFAEPVRAVQCAGDACATPFAPPSDLTPSSATFQGAGNVLGGSPAKARHKAKHKARAKRRCRARGGKRCRARHRGKAGRKARARHAMNAADTGRVTR